MKKGFTLIELLIVITIVAVITTLTFVGLNAVRGKSRDGKRVADIRQFQAALEMYKNDNDVYPSAATSGQPLVGIKNGYTYIKKVPTAPGTNDGSCSGTDAYTYSSSNTSATYTISYCLGGAVQHAGPSSCMAVPGQICVASSGGGGGGTPGSEGPRYPGSVAEDTTFGYVSWNNYNNILVADGSFMTANGSTDMYYAKTTNYSFGIPGTATITGIKAEVYLKAMADDDGNVGYVTDASVKLVKSGTAVGDNKARATGANHLGHWSTTLTYITYGGEAEMWGTSWTPAQINDSNFGLAFSARPNPVDGAPVPQVDTVRITVYYAN